MITFPRAPVADTGAPRGHTFNRQNRDDLSAHDGHHGDVMPRTHLNAIRLVSINVALFIITYIL